MRDIHVGGEGPGHRLGELEEFKLRSIHELPFTAGHGGNVSHGGADGSGQSLQVKALQGEEKAIDLTHPHANGVFHQGA
jgi:hypothetical protein